MLLGLCLHRARRLPQTDEPQHRISSPASKRATTTLAPMWAAAMPSARGLTHPACGSAPSAAYGRYHYDGSLPSAAITLPIDVRRRGCFRRGAGRLSVPSGRPSHRQAVRRHRGRGPAHRRRTIPTTRCKAARSVSGCKPRLARPLGAILSLGRRDLRHGLPGILGAGPARLSRAAAFLARAGRRRARQRGI